MGGRRMKAHAPRGDKGEFSAGFSACRNRRVPVQCTAAMPDPERPHPARNAPHRNLVVVLACAFAVLAAALAIHPRNRQDWALENALVVPALGILYAIYRKLPFSRMSWVLVFLFLCIHEIGAHYTYSEVPYDAWCRKFTGGSLNQWLGWNRNHFDRLVHLLYGLMLALPIREIFLHLAKVRGFWSYFLPLDLTMSTSALYELIEWAAAEIFGGDLGVAYVGNQGDPWDSQKDMAIAAAGALTALCLAALIHWRRRRDFAREWIDSLRIPPPEES
jgi:putative membrane protein